VGRNFRKDNNRKPFLKKAGGRFHTAPGVYAVTGFVFMGLQSFSVAPIQKIAGGVNDGKAWNSTKAAGIPVTKAEGGKEK
jgi:hypothetical protein